MVFVVILKHRENVATDESGLPFQTAQMSMHARQVGIHWQVPIESSQTNCTCGCAGRGWSMQVSGTCGSAPAPSG